MLFIRMRDYIMNVHSALRGSIEDAMTCAVGGRLCACMPVPDPTAASTLAWSR